MKNQFIFLLFIAVSCKVKPNLSEQKTISYSSGEKKNLNYYLMDVVNDINKTQQKKGYDINLGGFTRDLFYDEKKLFDAKGISHCVSLTYQVITESLARFNKDQSWLRSKIYGLNRKSYAQDFLACWYADAGCSGSRDALKKAGMGSNISRFKDSLPGDFINFDRINRTGHSVVFLSFIDKKGNVIQKYDEKKVVGFQYFTSNKSTKGVGIRNGYFDGYCGNAASGTADCKIIRNSLAIGRVHDPVKFKNTDFGLTSFLENNSDSFLTHEINVKVNRKFSDEM